MLQEISEHGSEEEDDSLSAITYESDLEMKSPKKTFQKCPPGPPKSPCYTKSKQIASWRSVKTAGTKPLSGRMALTPQKIMLRPSKQSPGAPAYKEKEAIYDEISELKKSLHSQKGDVDFMKTKLRQLEESNKKHQNMDPLLDPNQDSESVWNVIDKSSGSGWIIHGLKQRIIRLEQQCKEKDSTITKLQTDMKMTNLEEMRIAVDTYSEEIHRLQVLVADTDETERKSPIDKKSSQRRQKKLRAAVLYLSRTVQELQEENRSLKEDLDRVLSNSPVVNKAKSYSEWSKQRLMRRVSELEKRVGELENTSSPPERAMLAPSIRLIPNTALQGLLRSEYAEECE